MKKINLLIHGYGKVGRLVHKYAQMGEIFNVVGTVGREEDVTYSSIMEADLNEVEVIIDFTNGEALLNLFQYIKSHKPSIKIVVGSSGWAQEEENIKKSVKEIGMYFLYGANFSIGTALFMQTVNFASELFNKFVSYDVSLLDIHHRHKLDMPSGTAKKIAFGILNKFTRKNKILYGMSDKPIENNELHVNCLRVGENMGFHEVTFDSAEEVVKISQQTRDRGAYAEGALSAAKWLFEQTEPGYYTFDSYINGLLKN